MLHRSFIVRYLCAILFVVAPKITIAQSDAAPNPNCTLILPANPLSAEGLATPYQLGSHRSDRGRLPRNQ